MIQALIDLYILGATFTLLLTMLACEYHNARKRYALRLSIALAVSWFAVALIAFILLVLKEVKHLGRAGGLHEVDRDL